MAEDTNLYVALTTPGGLRLVVDGDLVLLGALIREVKAGLGAAPTEPLLEPLCPEAKVGPAKTPKTRAARQPAEVPNVKPA